MITMLCFLTPPPLFKFLKITVNRREETIAGKYKILRKFPEPIFEFTHLNRKSLKIVNRDTFGYNLSSLVSSLVAFYKNSKRFYVMYFILISVRASYPAQAI